MSKKLIAYLSVALFLGILFTVYQYLMIIVLLFSFSLFIVLCNKTKEIMHIFLVNTVFYSTSVFAIIIKSLYLQIYDSYFLNAGMVIIGINIIGIMTMLSTLLFGAIFSMKKKFMMYYYSKKECKS